MKKMKEWEAAYLELLGCGVGEELDVEEYDLILCCWGEGGVEVFCPSELALARSRDNILIHFPPFCSCLFLRRMKRQRTFNILGDFPFFCLLYFYLFKKLWF